MPRSHVTSIAVTLQNTMQKHGSLLQGMLTRTMHRTVDSFIQDPGFDSEPTFKQSYDPQSGAIFGILKQMPLKRESERRTVDSFIQDPGIDSEPPFKQSYAPQSGAIDSEQTFKQSYAPQSDGMPSSSNLRPITQNAAAATTFATCDDPRLPDDAEVMPAQPSRVVESDRVGVGSCCSSGRS